MSISSAGLENPADSLEPDPAADTALEKAVAGRSPVQQAMEQLRRDKVAVVCAVVIVVFLVLALLAPVICWLWGVTWKTPAPNVVLDSTDFDGLPIIGPPKGDFTWAHPLGLSPSLARDNLALWLYGARTSIGVALVATIASTVIGIVVGLVGGFARGWLETVVNWVINFFLSLPFILVALILAPIVIGYYGSQPGKLTVAQFASLLFVLSVFGWMPLARLIRGEVLSLREREFVQAARVIGVPTRTILRRELLPNLVAPIIVFFSLSMPTFVSAEAGLAYLGIGVTGYPSWGQTINDAMNANAFNTYPLYLWAPILGVLALVVALNLLGDAVRDAFDPKTRR
ncbi:ABC transporter permease [Solicola sp. PLA-1-18]|uniref:ABC transporter permease n=1 Tax=Solicola sp. PLA-1-18 TaxID=3380532 RepID=UPI003B811E18